ncbi:hypothetical protein ACFXTN_013144 [Malus domestica]
MVARSTSSFSLTFSTRSSSSSLISFFSGSTFGSAFSLCCASRRLTSVAFCKSFSSTVLVSLAIASLIYASCSSIEVTPVVMTYMAMRYELLLESASKVNDSEYLIGLSSFGALARLG